MFVVAQRLEVCERLSGMGSAGYGRGVLAGGVRQAQLAVAEKLCSEERDHRLGDEAESGDRRTLLQDLTTQFNKHSICILLHNSICVKT